MKRIATQLASQMNDAGITPGNIATHPAYTVAGDRFLKYAMDDNNNAVLGQAACTLHQDGNDWICWNDHGSSGYRISYSNGSWEVSKV
jgi:hypothetical protein